MAYEFGLSKKVMGVVLGVVSDNKHPDGQYKVKVKFPWIQSTDAGDQADYISSWARVTSQMAGSGRGMYSLPEVDDEVIVGFIHGDIRHPVVLGCVWNDKDKPPVGDKHPKVSTDPLGNDLGIDATAKDNKAANGKNTIISITTKTGTTMLLDQTDSKEKIMLFTKKGSMLAINDEKDVISIYDSTKEVYFTLDAKNKKIKLETKNGNVDILCKNGTFNLDANKITVHSAATSDWKSDGAFKLKGGADINIEASGTLTEKGSTIKLN